MWQRSDLKAEAKLHLKNNYLHSVIVGLILAILVGSYTLNFSNKSTIGNSTSVSFNDDGSIANSTINEYENILNSYLNEDSSMSFREYFNKSLSVFTKYFYNLNITENMISFVLIIVLFISLISLLLKFILLNPLTVGCQKWFIHSKTDSSCPISTIIYPLKNGFGNTIKVMFFMQLQTYLWTLLFIIPGIIKRYEYRMIPYLLAENPNMSRAEAFARSKDLMSGEKLNAFVLDLSFIGWNILGSLFFGFINIFFVFPYQTYTNMELYVTLCSKSSPNHFSGYNDNYGDQDYNNDNYGNQDYSNKNYDDYDYNNSNHLDD